MLEHVPIGKVRTLCRNINSACGRERMHFVPQRKPAGDRSHSGFLKEM